MKLAVPVRCQEERAVLACSPHGGEPYNPGRKATLAPKIARPGSGDAASCVWGSSPPGPCSLLPSICVRCCCSSSVGEPSLGKQRCDGFCPSLSQSGASPGTGREGYSRNSHAVCHPNGCPPIMSYLIVWLLLQLRVDCTLPSAPAFHRLPRVAPALEERCWGGEHEQLRL